MTCYCDMSCADPEGGLGTGGPDPLKNHKNKGFLSNTGPDPHHRPQATRHLNGVSLAGRSWPAFIAI